MHPGDEDCIFKDSPHLVGSWMGGSWTGMATSIRRKQNAASHDDIECQHVHFATELLIRELMVHPDSYLRELNPEEATLFYVPNFLILGAKLSPTRRQVSLVKPFWTFWGLRSKYWRRNQGADHMLSTDSGIPGANRATTTTSTHKSNYWSRQLPFPSNQVRSFVKMYPMC